jgi:hypothetical protein
VSGNAGKGCFEANAVVHIRHATLPHPAAGSRVAPGAGGRAELGADERHPEGLRDSHPRQRRDLDGGRRSVANAGHYAWTAPDAFSTQSRVAIVQLRPGGTEPEAEITESATFTISSTTGVGDGNASFALSRIAPNPAGSRFDVSFSLVSGAPATLGVFDVSGRRVASREVGGMGAGFHVVTFGDAAQLRPGLYVVRLSQQSKSLTTPVLILAVAPDRERSTEGAARLRRRPSPFPPRRAGLTRNWQRLGDWLC